MKLLITLLALGAAMAAEQTLDDVDELLNKGNDKFTAKMFKEVVNKNPQKSVVLSAFSVLTPLAQLGIASEGESHDELLKAIGLPDDNVTKVAFSRLNIRLRSVKGIDLKMASRVYIPKSYELDENFEAVSRDVFGSEVKNVDFTKQQETANEVNSWVESQTNKRIKDLVKADSLGPDTRALLVNAIYFKGEWKEKFNPIYTQSRDFHVSKSNTIKVPTMFKNMKVKYGSSDELQAKMLELPYSGDQASLLILLPNDIEGLPAMLEKLTNVSVLERAVTKMYETEADVFLPKFKIETTTDLKDVLQKIQVNGIFSESLAKLNHLLKGESDLFVSNAIQKAFIEVNEEGAEAAAANEFGISFLSAVINPLRFLADHPFAFYLKEGKSSIFSGAFYS